MKNAFTALAILFAAILSYGLSRAQNAPGSAQLNAAVDPDEARIADVITASHILTHEGILDSFGHVTTRSAKNPNRMFIPRAMPPALVQRADIVEVQIDNDCKPVDPNAPRLNGERFIHCEIYKANPDIQGIIHSHDLAVVPFGIAGIPLRPVIAQAGFLPPETPLFEVRDAYGNESKRGVLILNAKLGDALAAKLGKNPVVLMRGHGETVVGTSVRQATVRALYTNIDARAQMAALALSPKINALDDAELATDAAEQFDSDRPWQNFVSRLDSK
jgi:ribulose-5-phosphate 4-epimerase/fuculose-1-phosphate aldolase